MSRTKNSIFSMMLGTFMGVLLGQAISNSSYSTNHQAKIPPNVTLLPARDGRQRVPARYMINYLYKHLAALQRNPIGTDRLSEKGFTLVIMHLEYYEKEIDEGPQSPNPIWGILANHAKWFTTLEYQLLYGMALHTMGMASPAPHLRK